MNMDPNTDYQLRVLSDKVARQDQELAALRRRLKRLEEALRRRLKRLEEALEQHGIEVPKP
jgi:flagellar motility protein MotE (MotC chaperone)